MLARSSSLVLIGAMVWGWLIWMEPACGQEDPLKSIQDRPVKIDFSDLVQEGASPAKGAESSLRIAVAAMISPKSTYRYYTELLNLIGDLMGRQVVFVQKKTYAQVNEMMKRRELDLAFVCSGPYVAGKRDFGLEILAVPVCHGEKVYYSYFIASKGTGIDSFDDLRGKIFAFTDPLSNTGYLVPTDYLARRGETPESYFKKFFFTHSHDNSIQAVAQGLAQGAAVDSLIFDFIRNKNPELTKKTAIIEKSPPYGIPPVVVHPALAIKTKEAMQEIFLTIHQHPKGRAALERLQIDRFEKGNDADYDTVRELSDYLDSRQD